MIALLAALALADGPRAQLPELDALTFRPSADAGALTWTDLGRPGDPSARVLLHYAYGPLVYTYGNGARVTMIEHVAQADLVGGWVLGPLRVGAHVPVHLLATGEGLGTVGGLGDAAIHGKVTAVEAEHAAMGLTTRVTLPTSTTGAPLGAGALTAEVTAAGDVRVGAFTIAGNAGARLRPSRELEASTAGDGAVGRLGVAWTPSPTSGLAAEIHGRWVPRSDEASPAEALVTGWRKVAPAWTLTAGVGVGLRDAAGAPAARLLTGVTFAPPPSADADEDGIVDRVDRCPVEAEDADGFEDEDGCPDTDDDRDGVADLVDLCPRDAEDADGFEDDDGCPEAANPVTLAFVDPAGDPIPDVTVRVEGSTLTGAGSGPVELVLGPGSWWIDATADGVAPLRAQIAVPVAAAAAYELRMTPWDGSTGLHLDVVDPDGSPIGDARWSLDGVTWAPVPPDGRIPTPAGAHVVTVGAPGHGRAMVDVDVEEGRSTDVFVVLGPPRVELVGERITLSEEVFFDTGQATIRPESRPMLDEVAALLRARPRIAKVRVEGHSDSRGDELFNLELSEARAESVAAYLIARGVEPERLQAVGFGERQPLVEGDGPEAWDVNRRVDLFVVQWRD